MTLEEAAKKLGYQDYSPLRKAAKSGVLKTRRFGNVYVTTQEWLDEWATVKRPRGWPKGKPRRTDQPAPEELS